MDVEDRHHYTALSHACMNGHAEVVQLLLDSGAKINHRDGEKATPLIWTAINKHPAAAQVLVTRGAKLELKDQEGNAALHEACFGNIEAGSLEIVNLLVAHGATVDLLNRDRETPLQMASAGGLRDVVQYLSECGANINHVNKYGCTPLVQAMRCNHPGVVEMLLRLGADPALSAEWFTAAVAEIGSHGYTDVLEVLERYGLSSKR
ncbi:unnamed protein product [uncultured bacterium]|nr:unnamed protein product [uncultured bacterium]